MPKPSTDMEQNLKIKKCKLQNDYMFTVTNIQYHKCWNTLDDNEKIFLKNASLLKNTDKPVLQKC